MNKHAQALGRLGGKARSGKAKARTKAQARKAARARWDKVRAGLRSESVEPDAARVAAKLPQTTTVTLSEGEANP